jgi:diacylglycerol kinase family enzyme
VKVALIHNTRAGDALPPGELRRQVEKAGHRVVQEIPRGEGLALLDEDVVDLVAVAGGDGTIGDVVRALAGRGLPFALLPLGTANNIATSLGVEGEPVELASRWESARRIPFDLGAARGAWGQTVFLEGVGAGLVPAAMTAAKRRGKKRLARSNGGPLEGARRLYRRTLRDLVPSRYAIAADGERLDGEYLLVQVLNVARVGPNLAFAADADTRDGLLDLVLAGEEERERLRGRLENDGAPESEASALPVRRVRSVEIREAGALHVDDDLREGGEASVVSIDVAPASVVFLV